MGTFKTAPKVSWVGGKYPWKLERELVFQSDIIGEVVVPAGYCTDFASVPRIPGVYALTGGRAVLAAIVHDVLYDCWTTRISRRDADRVFLEAMAAAGDPKRWVTRQAMYVGVRAGGWLAWRRDSTHKCK